MTHTRLSSIRLFLAGVLLLFVLHNVSAAEKPNVLFLLIDDFGWADVGCNGSTFYETPNIDSLASQGVRFTDGYAACPVCSPTRASILTGKSTARLRLTQFLAQTTAGKVKPADFVRNLPTTETILPKPFKEAGYATCFLGKWHLGETDWPQTRGFDVNIGGCTWGAPKSGYFSPYRFPAGANLPNGPKNQYLTDRLTTEAIRFITQNKERPFFLYLSHYAVHKPLQAKKADINYFKKKLATMPAPTGPEFGTERTNTVRLIQNKPVYAAMVKTVDDGIGRILDTLSALGLDSNTIVVLTGDNGGLSTLEGKDNAADIPTSNVPLRAGKGWLYEGGIREPWIIKWPGDAKAGMVCSEPVISDDFYPTILEMAGLPLMPDQHRDGVSLVPLLRGDTTFRRGPIHWHYPHYSNQKAFPGGVIRDGDFKLIHNFEDNTVELYDLKNDMSETTDLASSRPAKAAEMRRALARWRADVGALMTTPDLTTPVTRSRSNVSYAPDAILAVTMRGFGTLQVRAFVSSRADVRLRFFDLSGRLAGETHAGILDAGEHSVTVAKEIAAGASLLCEMTAGKNRTVRMVTPRH